MLNARIRSRVGVVTLAIVALAAPVTACAPEKGADDDAPNQVTVIGLDYSFGSPDTLPPGPTAITFENRGAVPHEMILTRLKAGITLDNVLEGIRQEFTEGGASVLIADAGSTSDIRVLVDLLPGRTYALVCNFQDQPDAPPHIQLGMRKTFYVAGGTD
jgi:hypothetical protein